MTSIRSSSQIQQRVRKALRQHEMVLGGERVLLAVSGGLDSTVLLDVMARVAPLLKLHIAVAHFDHGLRAEESKKDAEFVVDAARQLGLRCYVGRGDIPRLVAESRLSVEEAARRVRYQFLARVARKHDYHVVMTGHNANDNAETLLMNLLRGTGVSGLAGIPPVRPLSGHVTLARPLLGASREEIAEHAREASLEWREDETNVSGHHTRNRIRHELLPVLREYNPSIIGTLNVTASIMRGVDQFLGRTVDVAVDRVVVASDDEQIELGLAQLRHYPGAIQTEVLQRAISRTFDIPAIPYGAVERTLALIWKESGAKAEIGGGLSAVRDRDSIIVRTTPPPRIPFERAFIPGDTLETDAFVLSTALMDRDRVRFTRNNNVEYADADLLPDNLVIRTWRDGDRFNPIGLGGEKKLSDFLIDQKVSLDRKRDVLVVAGGDVIVWVCGMRLDERYKVTPATKRAIRLELRRVTKSPERHGEPAAGAQRN